MKTNKKYDFYQKQIGNKPQSKQRSHKAEMIKYLLLDIQSFGGAAINPFSIGKEIKEYLDENYPSKNNMEHARNYSYVYACLNNHFRNMFAKYKMPDRFFATRQQWRDWNIGDTLIQNATRVLEEMGFISINENPMKPNWRIVYDIKLERLYELRNKLTKQTKTSSSKDLEYNENELNNIKLTVTSKYGYKDKGRIIPIKNDSQYEAKTKVINKYGDDIYLDDEELTKLEFGLMSDEELKFYGL